MLKRLSFFKTLSGCLSNIQMGFIQTPDAVCMRTVDAQIANLFLHLSRKLRRNFVKRSESFALMKADDVGKNSHFFEHRKRSIRARRQDRLFLLGLGGGLTVLIVGGGGLLAIGWLGPHALDTWHTFRKAEIWQRWGLVNVPPEQPMIPIPLADVPVLPQPLQSKILRTPGGVCKEIQRLGFTSDGWQRSRMDWKGWECLAEKALIVEGDKKASVFFSMRGPDETSISTMRLKLNLPPEGQGRKAYADQLVEHSLIPLFDYFRWILPRDLKEKIQDLEPFTTVMHGVKFRLFPEYGSNQHVHLMLAMPKPNLSYREIDGEVLSEFSEHKIVSPTEAKTKPRLMPEPNAAILLRRDAQGVIIPEEDEEKGGDIDPDIPPNENEEKKDRAAIASKEKNLNATTAVKRGEMGREQGMRGQGSAMGDIAANEERKLSDADKAVILPRPKPSDVKPTTLSGAEKETADKLKSGRLPISYNTDKSLLANSNDLTWQLPSNEGGGKLVSTQTLRVDAASKWQAPVRTLSQQRLEFNFVKRDETIYSIFLSPKQVKAPSTIPIIKFPVGGFDALIQPNRTMLGYHKQIY